jgi:phage gp36-like protein
MGYASLTDLRERLGDQTYVQLTDDAGTGVADEDVASEALGGAEGEMNSFLARRYAVPVQTGDEPEAAALLKSVAIDLAEHRLHSRRSSIPEHVRANREAAFRWLQLVAAGQAILPVHCEPAGNSAMGFAGKISGSPRVLTREEMGSL